jgi:uncharacterized protein (UPF0264 family)
VELLISVRDAAEAQSALAGGADIIDAKDPARGALGAVAIETLWAIHRAVGGHRPVSAALGDAAEEGQIERASREAAALGVAYVKVGFFGTACDARAGELLAAAVRGVRAARARRRTRVVAVAYADAARAESVAPRAMLEVASAAGADAVLLDTAFKDGGGLFAHLSRDAVAAWIAAAHAAALRAALAGGLVGAELPIASELGADIAGIRGAACTGGREGRVSRARVRALARAVSLSGSLRRPPALACSSPSPPPPAAPPGC